jgi:hypothetical protein
MQSKIFVSTASTISYLIAIPVIKAIGDRFFESMIERFKNKLLKGIVIKNRLQKKTFFFFMIITVVVFLNHNHIYPGTEFKQRCNKSCLLT